MTRVLLVFLSIPTILLISYFGVNEIRKWANRREVLDIPNERSSHTKPTPKGGGIIIVFLTVIGLMLSYSIYNGVNNYLLIEIYIICGLMIAVISLLDDLYTLRNSLRFTVHGLAAVFTIYFIGPLQTVYIPIFGNISLGWIGILITFIWLVGLTNVYNFMDGIDGIAAVQAIVAGVSWMIVGFLINDLFIIVIGTLIFSTCLGFIFHNWQPAKIFMGDVGSAFIGFSLAFLALYLYSVEAKLFIIGVIFVWPFVFDATFTLFRRLIKKENIFQAHRSHLYQRLVITGCSNRFVSLLYGLLAFAGVSITILYFSENVILQILSILLLLLLCVYLLSYVWRREMKYPFPQL